MKSSLLLPIIFTALAGVAHSAGYIMDLSGSSNGDSLVPSHPAPGVDGWTQSEANNQPDQPKAWITTVGSSSPTAGIAIGAYYDDLSGDPFSINRTVSLGLADSSFELTIGFMDSTALFPERNDFSIGLRDSLGNNLVTLNFLANSPFDTDPFVTGSWNVAIDNNPAFAAVFDNAIYDILFNFTANGSDIDFSVSVTDYQLVPAVFNQNGSILGAATETIGNINLGVGLGPSAAYGDNHMAVTGMSLIPEPSTALLAAIAGIGLLVRRKRD